MSLGYLLLNSLEEACEIVGRQGELEHLIKLLIKIESL